MSDPRLSGRARRVPAMICFGRAFGRACSRRPSTSTYRTPTGPLVSQRAAATIECRRRRLRAAMFAWMTNRPRLSGTTRISGGPVI